MKKLILLWGLLMVAFTSVKSQTAVLAAEEKLCFINYETYDSGWKVVETVVNTESGTRSSRTWYYNQSPSMTITNYFSSVDTTNKEWYLGFPGVAFLKKTSPPLKTIYIHENSKPYRPLGTQISN